MKFTVGIIGGGIAGSTIALKLTQKGISSVLIQSKPSLVNGPPFCHLHAGGALYREIPTQQCIKMLRQSIKTLKCYPFSVNLRPTLLTVPLRDPGTPQQIINRMKILTECYKKLIQQDESNAVLGKPEEYFRVFSREEVECLKQKQCPLSPKSVEQWMVPPAKFLNLDKFKFPLIMVQEYGLSALRVSAFLNLFLTESRNCQLLLDKTVTRLEKTPSKKWQVYFKDNTLSSESMREVDYLINAGGYKSGIIDDMAGFKKNRMVQFKAAYVTEWTQCEGLWPQVVIHGKRKTVNGMGQLTPYAGNMFQIHGMTEEITLFQNGLSSTKDHSSQPELKEQLEQILQQGWKQEDVCTRTMKAVQHIAAFIPSFASACTYKKPLYGAQQIPGKNPDLRSTEISYEPNNYARSQIVKSSTAIEVADSFIEKIIKQFNLQDQILEYSELQTIDGFRNKFSQVERVARRLAVDRGYPQELALFYN